MTAGEKGGWLTRVGEPKFQITFGSQKTYIAGSPSWMRSVSRWCTAWNCASKRGQPIKGTHVGNDNPGHGSLMISIPSTAGLPCTRAASAAKASPRWSTTPLVSFQKFVHARLSESMVALLSGQPRSSSPGNGFGSTAHAGKPLPPRNTELIESWW